MHTVERLIQELQTLLKSDLQDRGAGIRARSPSLVAAHLLERPVSGLEHGARIYETGLPRTHALDFLRERVSAARGFTLSGYDDEAWDGFYLEVPVRRQPVLVGPDERRDAPVDFWALSREEGLVVHVCDAYKGQIGLDCWAAQPGAAVGMVGEVDRAVEACALTHRRLLRLRADDYTFLALPEPLQPPRHPPQVEEAVGAVKRFLAAGAPGERFGTLWYGPPGNGKTSTVRGLLRESADATRLWVDPSAMQSGKVEETFALLARILRSLGEAEAALVLFEDVDLISGGRGGGEIRTWLSALDGVERYRCRVAFVGLTNLSPQDFDPAVIRPARLGDLLVEFGPPDRERRRLILGDHLGPLLPGPVLDRLAARTEGFSGAEVELLCRRARWNGHEALRDGRGEALEDLLRAVRPSLGGTPLGFRV